MLFQGIYKKENIIVVRMKIYEEWGISAHYYLPLNIIYLMIDISATYLNWGRVHFNKE